MHRANPVTGRQRPLPVGRSPSLAQSLGADQPPCPRFEQAIGRRALDLAGGDVAFRKQDAVLDEVVARRARRFNRSDSSAAR